VVSERGLETPAVSRAGAQPDAALLLIANRNASGLARREQVDEAVRTLRSRNAAVEVRLTGDLHELGEAISAARGRVVLLGGDGSVHAVANLPGPLPALALLPAGRANNIARSLGIPLDLEAAAGLAANGIARPLDVIEARADGRVYRTVEGVSVGFHARARVHYQAENSAAIMQGLAVGISTLRKFRPVEIVVEGDGEREVMTVAQLFAANLPLYGFGLRVAPGADAADGELDLVTIEARTRRSLLKMIPRVYRGTHLGLPGVRASRMSHVRIDPRGSSPVIADSTDLGSGPVDLTVLPGELRVVTP
jgi:diacylglycerol kinase (ATP)